jgi:acetylglutamate kinase
VDGLRVTDDESLDVAEMILSGLVNKRLVARLVSGSVPAIGLSGVDNGLFRTAKMKHPSGDLGWVGDVVDTNTAEIEALLSLGIVPIVSPISLGLDGHTYNVNADHAARALACALGASELVFLSNVPGVLMGSHRPRDNGEGKEIGPLPDGECIPLLTPEEVSSLIASGEIQGGMVPKVRSALSALRAGVPRVRITNLEGLCVGGGTCFSIE